ncbi:MAG: hypothetical protein C0433_05870 [Cyclobacterium sp.]|nr:hypothetical protein [Cyclobacterium sp.]
MLLYSKDKLPFGKYRGIEVGMIYLLAPSYINWMLETDKVNYCIGDIDFLQSLKVINRFGNQGYLAHGVEVDRQEFDQYWTPNVTFEDLKFSGYETFTFSKTALIKNEDKFPYYGFVIQRNIVPESEREILIFYPSTGLKSEKGEFTPTRYSESTKGTTMVSFNLNNQRRNIDIFPHQPVVKVSSLFLSHWTITEADIDKRIKEKSPFVGRINEGFLELEK